MGNFISKSLFFLGANIRNPHFFQYYKVLINSDFSTRSDLDKIQHEKLKDLLAFAFRYSPFYKDMFLRAGLDFKVGFDPFEYLSTIDTVSKNDLIIENARIHTTSNYKFNKLFFSETSGSSGEALTFYKNEEWDSANRASIARGMSWYGVNFWDRNGYFWGYSFSSLRRLKSLFLDLLQNRYRVFSYHDEDIKKFIKKTHNATYIHGYSSMIYEVAKKVVSDGYDVNNLKLIKGTSEKIYNHYHDTVRKAFGKKIISEYGAAEAGIIAFECPHGSMHVNEENCIVEIVDGKIVVTNLVSYSFPVIRYELGDYVSISNKSCKCGRLHKVIDEVLGRVGKNIIGHNDIIFPSLTLYYIFKVLAIEHCVLLNYKAEQHAAGELKLLLDRTISDDESFLIKKVAFSYFSDSIDIVIVPNVLIHDKTKKLKDFESYI